MIIMYKVLESKIDEVNVFLGILDQTLTKFEDYFIGNNVKLAVPEGHCLPLYSCLSYKFGIGLLTVMPLEYAYFYEDGFTLYGEIVDMAIYLQTLRDSITSGKVLDNVEGIISDLDFFIHVKKTRLASDIEGFDKAVKIIEDLKTLQQ